MINAHVATAIVLAASVSLPLVSAVADGLPAEKGLDGKVVLPSLKCTRASHRYRVEEAAEFLVDAVQSGIAVEVKFCRIGREPLESVITTTPARVSFSLGKPGFIRCRAKRLDGLGTEVSVGAAFEPERLKPSLPPPDDYDQFWDNAFKELERIPADYVKRRIAPGVYAVSCNTVNGKRQYGFLRLPEGAGPYPLKVRVGGGEAYFTEESALSGGTPTTSASLMIHLPPYEPAERDGKAHHEKWLRDHGLKRFIFENIDNEPRDLYFYPCILGGCRLIDFAVKESSIDHSRISYQGSSHGGGFGVYLTAFSPHIKAAFCGVPNFGNLSGPVEGRPIGISDGPFQKEWRKLRYFDAAYCARRISVPVFMSVGFVDDAVAPDSVYTIYNELRGPKFMFDKVDYGHGGGPAEYKAVCAAWIDNVLNFLILPPCSGH